MSKVVLLFLLIALPMVPGSQSDPAPSQTHFVSLIQLIATPERYDGKVVKVAGFMHLEFEGDELFVSREDFDNRITKNGVWIVRNPNLVAHADELKDRYVVVVGTFSTGGFGYSDLMSGLLTKITHAGPWPARGGIQKWND
jgi:hypothetical protein